MPKVFCVEWQANYECQSYLLKVDKALQCATQQLFIIVLQPATCNLLFIFTVIPETNNGCCN